jgi:hypothetical protein
VPSYHVGVVEFAIILLLVGALVLIVGPRMMRRRGASSDWLQGRLLITGVSPRPDGVSGEQFVTITGVINGPTLNEYTVYTRLAVDVNDWPSMGQLHDVMYSPKNPEKWAFGTRPEPLQPPPDQQPYN